MLALMDKHLDVVLMYWYTSPHFTRPMPTRPGHEASREGMSAGVAAIAEARCQASSSPRDATVTPSLIPPDEIRLEKAGSSFFRSGPCDRVEGPRALNTWAFVSVVRLSTFREGFAQGEESLAPFRFRCDNRAT